jgi:hypothetical protein
MDDAYPERKFDPPELGMWPNETIAWTRRAGYGFWIICWGAMLLIGAPMLLAFGALEYAADTLFYSSLILIGAALIIRSIYRTRRTRYYLTTERIIEVHGDAIHKEIPLDRFAGMPLGNFLESRVTHTVNDRPIYSIRIYDPRSEETLEMKGLDRYSAQAIEQIGTIRECEYCNYDNAGFATRCKNCGAVL